MIPPASTEPMPDDVIEVKCWSVSFRALKSGDKRFEFRKDDRPYAVGKTVHQREWNPDTEYTGDSLYHDITWIIHGGVFGIPEGYCIYSASEPRSTRARGVAQQAPATCETCLYQSCMQRGTSSNAWKHCVDRIDIRNALAWVQGRIGQVIDENKAIAPELQEAFCKIRMVNERLPNERAALIAQEREKWERERLSCVEDITPEGAAIVQAVKKQAREDVLKRLHLVVPLCDALIEKFDCQSQLGFNALLIKRELESLRSEVGK